MRLRGQEIGRRLASSEAVLARLRSSKGYDESYFSNQWDRQRRLQQSAISQKAIDLRNKLGVLMKLEEELIETRCVKPRVHITQTSHHLKTEYNFCRDTIQKLQLKRVRRRKQSKQKELLNLPKTLAVLEQKIQDLASELGSKEFLELTGVSGIFLFCMYPGVYQSKA